MAKWIIEKTENCNIKGPSWAPVSLIELVKRRGVSDDKIEDFLSDKPVETYDPFLFDGLRQAAEKLIAAMDAGKKICVYGDYDADGVTSTSLLLCVFSHFTKKLCYHIPSRFKDGYGLNKQALCELAYTHAPDLLITVDCGSTSKAEVAYAKELGMEVIVTDHHSLRAEDLPDCCVINPKSENCNYPFKELSGCGVAFKLAQAIQRVCAERGRNEFGKYDLDNLLDLVAISTVADVVPLLGENRTLVKYGLAILNGQGRPGIKALLQELKLDQEVISADNIAFILAPHINALGRMKNADLAVELLWGNGKSYEDLQNLAHEMVENNNLRKRAQTEARTICDNALAKEDCGKLMPVIYAKGGHEGVAGIVAGNYKELFYRPVLILTDGADNSLKGTGRCIPGLDLHSMLSNHSELFLRFGGHSGACGFSIEKSKLQELRECMQREMEIATAQDPDILTEKLYIEKELSEEDKNVKFAKALNKLEPCGEANPHPMFCMLKCKISGVRTMGKDKQHLRFNAKAEKDRISVSCVLFSKAAEYKGIITDGAILDLAGNLTINEFLGRQNIQFVVKDIRTNE